MEKFAWKQGNKFNIGDTVNVAASISELENIGLDSSYSNINGIVMNSTNESTLVSFGNETWAFYNNMLVKIDTYNDLPDTDEYSDSYVDEMSKAYGMN